MNNLDSIVRKRTSGSKVLVFSNRADPELSSRLEKLLGITITWCITNIRKVQAQAHRMVLKGYDMILSLTGFQAHSIDSLCCKNAKAVGVPYVRVNRGRPQTCLLAIAREFGLT